MNKLLKKVKDIYQDGCVTITLNTHRTRPDYKKDALKLKNLVKEAEKRLYDGYDKRFVWPIMKNLNKTAENIDHSLNLESLVIFAKQDFSDYTRLPVEVTDRVVIDNTFATRDLVRALHQESSYYILVLSRHKARLIEAFNDKLVSEFKGELPMVNTLYTTDRTKLSTKKGQDNLVEEFFNQVNKYVLKVIAEDPLPIIIVTETRNFDHFIKVADKKELIVGHLNRNRDNEKAGNIVKDAWKEVLELVKMNNMKRIEELHKAVGNNKFVSDYNEIWSAIQQGKGKTLFIKKGFFQPALLSEGKITIITNIDTAAKGVIDDIVDEMIEQNISRGGDTVFLEGNELSSFNNLALITRY